MSRIGISLPRTGDSPKRIGARPAVRPLRLLYCGAAKRRRDIVAPCRERRVSRVHRDLLQGRSRSVATLRPLASAFFHRRLSLFPVRAELSVAAALFSVEA